MPKLVSLSTFYVCVTLISFTLTSPAQAAPDVTNLGILPIANEPLVSAAHAISNKGEVVVGIVLMTHNELAQAKQTAFRWTHQEGMKPLPYLPGGGNVATADAVSADGRVIVGASDGINTQGTRFWSHATRWQIGKAPYELETLPGGEESAALGVSRNGNHIVGYSNNRLGHMRAVLWQAQDQVADLGDLGGLTSMATGISGDGHVVVGATQDATHRSRAFIWQKANGMRDIGSLPGMPSAIATAISASGDVVIGCSADKISEWLNPQAAVLKGFIWQRTSGKMQEIVNTLGGLFTLPMAVSDGGRSVVGMAMDAHSIFHAFRWTPENGMVVETTLPAASHMSYAKATTSDGHYTVGQLTESGAPFRARWH